MLKKCIVLLWSLLLISPVFAQSVYKNVMLSNENAPNELNILMNPKNPNNIVVAANIDNYYFSFDGGLNWVTRKQESKFGVWGDPCLVMDSKENLYYFHLALTSGYSNDRLVCQKSTNGGISWNALDTFLAYNSPHIQDKEWACADITDSPYKNNIYVTWTQCGQGEYENDGTRNPGTTRKTDIFISSSSNEGTSWTSPKQINNISGSPCDDVPNTVLGVTSCIGQYGELYVCWVSGLGLIFERSTDGGVTWLDKDVTVDSLPAGFKYDVPGIYRCFGFPSIACDRSGGKNNGRIYISWPDQRSGPDNTDVWLSWSDDGGKTWIKYVKVNDDESVSHQFGSWMTLDQSDGNLYFVYYDIRNYTTENTDVYLAKSDDGGASFTNERISESPFSPEAGTFFGDYIGIAAVDGIVRPVWTRLDHSLLSVWTAIINNK